MDLHVTWNVIITTGECDAQQFICAICWRSNESGDGSQQSHVNGPIKQSIVNIHW